MAVHKQTRRPLRACARSSDCERPLSLRRNSRTSRCHRCRADRSGCSRLPVRARGETNSRTWRGRRPANPLRSIWPHHRGALGAAGPVPASPILARREGATIRLRAGQHVVIVRRKADAGNNGAALGLRVRRSELVVVAVEIVDVLGDDLALEVLPRAASDAIAGIDRLRAVGGLRAEDRPATSCCRRRRLAQASGTAGLRLPSRRGPRPCRGRC